MAAAAPHESLFRWGARNPDVILEERSSRLIALQRPAFMPRRCLRAPDWPTRWLGQHDQVMPSRVLQSSAPPIGCNVKRESEAFLDEFSACLIAGGETAPRQPPLAPLRFGSRRRLIARPSPSPCFSLGSGTALAPQRVKAAWGPTSIGARSASFLWPIARLLWP
jgi:hypothetical protein